MLNLTLHTMLNISQPDDSMPKPEVTPNFHKRLRGNLKIFQLNTAKKSESGSALSCLMGDCRYSLAFITEPPFYNGKVCVFPSAAFNIFHLTGNKRSKGVELSPLPAYTDEDTTSALTSIHGGKTCIVSTYVERDHLIPETLHKVCHFAAVDNYGLLVCTDSNAHRTLWGSPNLYQQGRLVEEDLVYRYGLQLLNVGTDPTYIGHLATTGTIVDLTLASAQTAASITNWKVSND